MQRTKLIDPGGLMASRVRVPSTGLALGGWKGTVEIDGDVLRILGEDAARRMDIDCAQVKRCSFNGNSGLWAFRMKDGKKIYLQTSGVILSADRSPAGHETNEAIEQLMGKHGVKGFSI